MTRYLTYDQVIRFQKILIKKFGGYSGVRNLNLLHSALDAPKASFSGKETYPNFHQKAAVLLFHLVKNHPFIDANIRTAYVVVLVFFNINKQKIHFDVALLEQIVIMVAEGQISKEKLILFFKNGSLD